MDYNIVNLDYASLYPNTMNTSSTSPITNFEIFLKTLGYIYSGEKNLDIYKKNSLKININAYGFEGKHILTIYENNKHIITKLTNPNKPFLNDWCNLVKKYERKEKIDKLLKRI